MTAELIDKTSTAVNPAYPVLHMDNSFALGVTEATDTFTLFNMKKGMKVLALRVEWTTDPDSAEYSIGTTGVDTDLFVKVTDMAPQVLPILNEAGANYTYSADTAMTMLIGTVSTPADCTIDVTVFYVQTY